LPRLPEMRYDKRREDLLTDFAVIAQICLGCTIDGAASTSKWKWNFHEEAFIVNIASGEQHMTLISPAEYVNQREAYNYTDSDVQFTIVQTGNLPGFEHSAPQIDLDKIKAGISPLSDQDLRDALLKFRIREKKEKAGNLPVVGTFTGIFPSAVPLSHPAGINIRKFEVICQSVFKDCSDAETAGNWTDAHLNNLKNVSRAIVHWKMASQGGRAPDKVKNVAAKWTSDTHKQLLDAYRTRNLGNFRIGGVAIPTATAFLRFLYPDEYGVMDTHVVNEHTQPNGITTLDLRKEDGYILNLTSNVKKYDTEYILFLRTEATAVNSGHTAFRDVDATGNNIVCSFRPCDIEMALFGSRKK